MAAGRGLTPPPPCPCLCDPGVCTQMLTRACVVSMVHVWVWTSVCVRCVHVVRCLHLCVECVACRYVICVWGVFMCLSMCVFTCVWGGWCAPLAPLWVPWPHLQPAFTVTEPARPGPHRPGPPGFPPSQSRGRKRKCPPSAHFRAAEAAGRPAR